MTASETFVLAQSAPGGDIKFAVQKDDGTQVVTPEMADLAARASLVSILGKLIAAPATEASLAAAAGSLVSILAKLPTSPALDATLSAGITSIVNAITATQTVTGTVTANLGTIGGAATQTTLAAVLTALGGNLAITAAALPLPAGAATQTTLAAILTALGAALPLPIGASTSAAQTTLQTSATSIDGKLTGIATAAKQDAGNTALVSILAALVAALPLPTGASTAANQATEVASLATLVTQTTPAASGAQTTANSRSTCSALDDPNFGPSVPITMTNGSLTGTGTFLAETDVSAYAGMVLQITGNGAGLSVGFNLGNVSGSLSANPGISLGQTTSNGPTATVTSNQNMYVPFHGFQYANILLGALSSGTVTVTGRFVKRPVVPWAFSLTTTVIQGVSLGPSSAARGQNPATTGGILNIKNTAGVLNAGHMHNKGATAAFGNLYNKTTTPILGTDTPLLTFPLPAAMIMPFGINCGPCGRRFTSGIGLSFTTDFAAATGVTAAADCTYDLSYT